MIQKLKQTGIDIRVGFLLIGISISLMLVFNINFPQLIISNLDIIIKIIYLTAIAMGISTAIHFLIPENFAEKHMHNNKLSHLFYATLLGVLTPGPVYAIYPIVMVLKKKGIKNPILVAFLTGQTIIGPARAPFEIGFFGIKFYIYRILLALIMGPVAALLFIFLSRFWPDKKKEYKNLIL